jgi:hypothetical protein
VNPIPTAVPADPPSLVELIARGTMDADLAALIWVLVEGGVPVVVAAPSDRLGAAAQLLKGLLASIRPEVLGPDVAQPLTVTGVRKLIRGTRAGGILAAGSLEDIYRALQAPPLPLSDDELTFLGCVLILGAAQPAAAGAPGQPPRGRLRVRAAHYVRPLARDAHGHAQRLGPAVLATWDDAEGHYEHFSWGVLPEIASRLDRRGGDLEQDLHHRRDDLGGLASAGVTALPEVRRLIAGYHAGYGHPHDPATH